MRLSDFDYDLPAELIAQTPIRPRDHSRLLVLHRDSGAIEHRHFLDFPEYLRSGDVAVFNDTRVFPARLRGHRVPRATSDAASPRSGAAHSAAQVAPLARSGLNRQGHEGQGDHAPMPGATSPEVAGQSRPRAGDRAPEEGATIEALLLREEAPGVWDTLVKPGRRVRVGDELSFGGELTACVIARTPGGGRRLAFSPHIDMDEALARLGETPLPPYIHRAPERPDDYQTIYARRRGSSAAPTAGLHFTPRAMRALEARGVGMAWLTLHIGLATFRPIREEEVERHEMHAEWCHIPPETVDAIAAARARGGRCFAVGTTTARALEAAAQSGELRPFEGETDIFITPGYRFRVVDALLTNFHMPRSTLLLLVCAFAAREPILAAYAEAVKERYRFLSFGDAMLVT